MEKMKRLVERVHSMEWVFILERQTLVSRFSCTFPVNEAERRMIVRIIYLFILFTIQNASSTIKKKRFVPKKYDSDVPLEVTSTCTLDQTLLEHAMGYEFIDSYTDQSGWSGGVTLSHVAQAQRGHQLYSYNKSYYCPPGNIEQLLSLTYQSDPSFAGNSLSLSLSLSSPQSYLFISTSLSVKPSRYDVLSLSDLTIISLILDDPLQYCSSDSSVHHVVVVAVTVVLPIQVQAVAAAAAALAVMVVLRVVVIAVLGTVECSTLVDFCPQSAEKPSPSSVTPWPDR